MSTIHAEYDSPTSCSKGVQPVLPRLRCIIRFEDVSRMILMYVQLTHKENTDILTVSLDQAL